MATNAIDSRGGTTIPTVETSGRLPVLGGQVLGSLGLGAAGASGALLISHVTGSDRLAAAPLGAVVLGGVLSAWPVARQRSRSGRAQAFALALLVAGLGSLVVLTGAATTSAPLVLLGHVLIGAGNTAVMMSRYLVADLVPPGQQARAMGTSFLAVSCGAVGGPALLGPSSALAARLGLPAPAGLYAISVVAMLLAGTVFAATSRRPATASVDRRSAHAAPGTPAPTPLPTGLREAARGRPGLRAHGATGTVLSLGAANLTMVSLMAVLPLHLGRHGHGLDGIGWAVSAHVAAMFLGSWAFGPITHRLGTRAVVAIGNVILAGTAAAAVVLPIESMTTGTLLLVSLGLGWGAVVVANSTHLSALVAKESRGSLEASSEIAMGLGAMLGCFAFAGPLVVAGGVALLAAAVVPLHVVQLLRALTGHVSGTSTGAPLVGEQCVSHAVEPVTGSVKGVTTGGELPSHPDTLHESP